MGETGSTRSPETALVVDAHTHVVSADSTRYPLTPHGFGPGGGESERPASEWFRTHPLSVEGLLAALLAAGVDRAVLVQAMGAYEYDNSYCADAASAHAGLVTSVSIVDAAADDAVSRLHHWVRGRGMRGVRLFAIGPGAEWLDGPAGVALMEAAESLSIPVVATILASEIPRLGRILARFPGVPVALDHCGFPDLRDGPTYPEARSLFELARYANLRLKVSGFLLAQVERGGGRPSDLVSRLASEFGASRLLWGSDYPQTHDRSYEELVTLGREAARGLSEEERGWYLGGTALELWPELRSDPRLG